jgi:hypothetical protein
MEVIENAAHSRALTRWTRETLGAGHVGEMVGRLKGEPRAAPVSTRRSPELWCWRSVRLSLEQSPRTLYLTAYASCTTGKVIQSCHYD